MLATPERDRTTNPEGVIWHKPVGRPVEDFQAIACSDTEGITLPWAKQDVPLSVDKPGERWCPDCLGIVRGEKKGSRP